MELNKICQSCGMPLKKDPNGGGTEADGSKSLLYCSYCYKDGQFTQPQWTAEKMQAFGKSKLMEMGFPGFLAGLFTRGVPKLKRWQKQN